LTNVAEAGNFAPIRFKSQPFRSRIQKRAERQRAVFPRAGCAGPRVAEADFAWLEPEPPRKIIPPSLPSMDR
jgi:hypothetical protein